jgi:hypothetical protein
VRHGCRVVLVEFDQFLRRLRRTGPAAGQYDAPVMRRHQCYAGWGFFQLFPDGNFNSCCRIVEPRGNLAQNDFAVVWNGPGQQAFRRLTRDLDREKVDAHNLPCGGLCDNLQDTRHVAQRLAALPKPERLLLDLLCGRAPGTGQ